MATRHHAMGCQSLADLPAGSLVGTSSMRRTALLRRNYPALKVESVRGNLQLRLAKLDGANDHPQKYVRRPADIVVLQLPPY